MQCRRDTRPSWTSTKGGSLDQIALQAMPECQYGPHTHPAMSSMRHMKHRTWHLTLTGCKRLQCQLRSKGGDQGLSLHARLGDGATDGVVLPSGGEGSAVQTASTIAPHLASMLCRPDPRPRAMALPCSWMWGITGEPGSSQPHTAGAAASVCAAARENSSFFTCAARHVLETCAAIDACTLSRLQ